MGGINRWTGGGCDIRGRVLWALEKGGKYSTRSMYMFLSLGGGGVTSRRMQELWKAKVPLKVRVFLWQMFNDKLQTTEQLMKREWKGEVNYPLCEVKEDVNHIMFSCVLRKFVWTTIRETFGWSSSPTSLEGFVSSLMRRGSGKHAKLCLFGLGVVCWALWKVHNKMRIEHKLIRSHGVVMFNIIVLLQQWKVFLSAECLETVEVAINKLRSKMKPMKKEGKACRGFEGCVIPVSSRPVSFRGGGATI
jgi:hypothetical protein